MPPTRDLREPPLFRRVWRSRRSARPSRSASCARSACRRWRTPPRWPASPSPAARPHRRRRRDERIPVPKGIRRRVPPERKPRVACRARDQPSRVRVLARGGAREDRESRLGEAARRHPERVCGLRSGAKDGDHALRLPESQRCARNAGNQPRTLAAPTRSVSRIRSAARQDAERALADTERSVGRLAHLLVGTSIAGAIASLLAGFLWARRITKPIYELEVQVQSAAERTRIQVAPGRAGLESLGDQVSAMVEKLEETDAASPSTAAA